ncbi:MAG TPA: glycosyltransferase family 2 protein, partial [Limnochordia bacterium]
MSRVALSVCMIVKDEEEHLDACLKSVAGVADEIVVVDTGSTDRTVEIAKAHGARVIEFEWCDDFAAARNAGLEVAKGEWILMIDADETVFEEDRELLRRTVTTRQAVEAFWLNIHNVLDDGEEVIHAYPRLFRNRPHYRFRGAVHEQIATAITEKGGKIAPSPVRLRHTGYLTRVVISRNKVRRNVTLLERLVAQGQDDDLLQLSLGHE